MKNVKKRNRARPMLVKSPPVIPMPEPPAMSEQEQRIYAQATEEPSPEVVQGEILPEPSDERTPEPEEQPAPAAIKAPADDTPPSAHEWIATEKASPGEPHWGLPPPPREITVEARQVEQEPLPAIEIVDLLELPGPELEPPAPVRAEQTVVSWSMSASAVPAVLPIIGDERGGMSFGMMQEYGALREKLGRIEAMLEGKNQAPTAAAQNQGAPAAAQSASSASVVAQTQAVQQELPALPPDDVVATTDVLEIKANIQTLADRLMANAAGLKVRFRIFQDHAAGDGLGIGYQTVEKSVSDFLKYRHDHIIGYGQQDDPLVEMDNAYINAEASALEQNGHLLQSILHEIDKLSLIYDQLRRGGISRAVAQQKAVVELGLDLNEQPEQEEQPQATAQEEPEPAESEGISEPDDEEEEE